jgi:hypothetical protein
MPPTNTTPPTLVLEQQQLEQELAALQARIAQLEAVPRQAPAPRRGPKVAVPDVFDGNRTKADSFLRQLRLYFTARSDEFSTDQDCIVFALSYMKGGTAGTWADRMVASAGDDKPTFSTWTNFEERFKHTFMDPDPDGAARFKMDNLQQGQKTADEYVAAFQELAAQTGYNETAHIDKFERGLKPLTVSKIYNLAVMPTTLEEWYDYALRFDHQQRKLDARRPFIGSNTRFGRPANTTSRMTTTTTAVSAATPVLHPGVPMDIDTSRRSHGRFTCYNCGEEGHLSRNCPHPRKTRIRATNNPPDAPSATPISGDQVRAIIQEELGKILALNQDKPVAAEPHDSREDF